jgi:cytosol alanyl aminopeptidase
MRSPKARVIRFATLASLLGALIWCADAAETAAPPQLRLGDTATPVSYEAQLAIDPRETSYSGTIRIELRFNRASPILWLNASALTVEAAEIAQGARKIAVKVIPGGEDFVGFAPEEGSFDAGPAVATIRYRGVVDSVTKRGVYRQSEGGEWYVITQFEAISARFAFPCFDEPGWKTPWRLTIDAP